MPAPTDAASAHDFPRPSSPRRLPIRHAHEGRAGCEAKENSRRGLAGSRHGRQMRPAPTSPHLTLQSQGITERVLGVVEQVHAGQLDEVLAELGECWTFDGPAVSACWGALAVGLCEQRQPELERLVRHVFDLFRMPSESVLRSRLVGSVALYAPGEVFRARETFDHWMGEHEPAAPRGCSPWGSSQELLSYAVARAVIPLLLTYSAAHESEYLSRVLGPSRWSVALSLARERENSAWPCNLMLPASVFEDALGVAVPAAMDWEQFADAVYASVLEQVAALPANREIPF